MSSASRPRVLAGPRLKSVAVRARRLVRIAFLSLVVLAPIGELAAQTTDCDDPKKPEVRGLRFKGNKAFGSDELALKIVTTPSSFFQRHLGHLGVKRCIDRAHAELAKDIVRLQTFYSQRGYPGTAVDTIVRSAGRNAIDVTFTIREGEPVLIDSVAVTGLHEVADTARVLDGLGLRVGERFDEDRLFAAADSIEGRLRNRGYAMASVLKSWDRRGDQHRASVMFNVLTGPRMRIGTITPHIAPYNANGVDRPEQISPAVVQHLVDIKPGDIYSDTALIAAQKNLYGTSDYVHADVVPVGLDSVRTVLAGDGVGGPDTLVNLAVNVREDLTQQIGGELLGYATLDCFRTRPQYSDHNFLHQAYDLEVTAQLSKLGYGVPSAWGPTHRLCEGNLSYDDISSSKLNYSLNTTLHPPIIGSHALPTYSLYTERRGEYLAYLRNTYIGGEAAVTTNLLSRVPLRLGYTLEYGNTQAPSALLCAVFSRCTEAEQAQATKTLPFAVASLSAQRSWANNVLDPTQGGILRGEVRGSSHLLGSDTSLAFIKGIGDATWYHGLAPGVVFAARLRAGAITGGATANGTKLPPPQERLYAGGPTSVRGFAQNELGSLIYLVQDPSKVQIDSLSPDSAIYKIKDSASFDRIVPEGGNELLVANFDLRLRSPFLPQLLQYTLFMDAGAVQTGAIRRTDLKWTPGIGIRVFSPVGPVQANIGYNPYPLPPGAVYFLAPVTPSRQPADYTGFFCIAPNNGFVVTGRSATSYGIQAPGTCPSDRNNGAFQPPSSRALLSRLTFSFSIGSDF